LDAVAEDPTHSIQPIVQPRRFLVTGAAGFIGSAVVRKLIGETPHEVLVLDKLTYAGNLDSLAPVAADPRYRFVRADICDACVFGVVEDFAPDVIMHLAAESHVDRSIDGPSEFVTTNVYSTFNLLQAALAYWRKLGPEAQSRFRFHHVSTDEVFGSLEAEGHFNESTATTRARRTPRPKRHPTISSAPGTTPMACRRSSPTAPTTTARTIFPRS